MLGDHQDWCPQAVSLQNIPALPAELVDAQLGWPYECIHEGIQGETLGTVILYALYDGINPRINQTLKEAAYSTATGGTREVLMKKLQVPSEAFRRSHLTACDAGFLKKLTDFLL